MESMHGTYESEMEIPLPNVSTKSLEMVVKWIEHW